MDESWKWRERERERESVCMCVVWCEYKTTSLKLVLSQDSFDIVETS